MDPQMESAIAELFAIFDEGHMSRYRPDDNGVLVRLGDEIEITDESNRGECPELDLSGRLIAVARKLGWVPPEERAAKGDE